MKQTKDDNNFQFLAHRHFSCMKAQIRKPTRMRENGPLTSDMTMFKILKSCNSKEKSNMTNNYSFTSDDLLFRDPLSMSPIKPSSQPYLLDESALLADDYFERGLREIMDTVQDYSENQRIIKINSDLDRQIQEIETKSKMVLTKEDKKKIMVEYFGSEMADFIEKSETVISYEDYCKEMNEESLKNDITKYFLVNIDTLMENNYTKEDIQVLNKSKIDNFESMKHLVQKFSVSLVFEDSRAEQFLNYDLPPHVLSSICHNMENCFDFIEAKLYNFTEEELYESTIFMIRTFLSIKILSFKTNHNLNILDPLSFGKMLPLIHRSLERSEQEFPTQVEKIIGTISQIFKFVKFDNTTISTIIKTVLTPIFSQFVSSMVWSHQSLLVNKLFKSLLLLILTRTINEPMSVSEIIQMPGGEFEAELILKTLKFTKEKLLQFQQFSDDGCYDCVYLIYNIYYLLVACFSYRNYNGSPLFSYNKKQAKECKEIFHEIAKHMKTLSNFQYQQLMLMRLEVFITHHLPAKNNII